MSNLAEAQAAAVERLATVGAPTPRAEDWRYVGLKNFNSFELEAAANADVDQALAALPALGQAHVVLLDGVMVQQHDLKGASITAEVSEAQVSSWQERLSHADYGEIRSLAELKGCCSISFTGMVDEPLVIVSINNGTDVGWRLNIDLAKGAAADVILVHLHRGTGRNHCHIDATSAAGSALRVDELEIGSLGQHLISKHLQIGKDANQAWCMIGRGGALSRYRTEAHLNDTGSHVDLLGLGDLRGTDQQHHIIRVYHHAGPTTSRQAFKTIADGESIASFDGLIHVDKGADGTDAYQNSANMQLGPRARIATRPQLDIYADDVQASHGATVGQPDIDEIRYLRSRGIDGEQARRLIINGFIEGGLDHIHHDRSRALIEAHWHGLDH